MIYLNERSNARVKTIFKPSGNIVFLYLNAKCCETKWLASFSSSVNTFSGAASHYAFCACPLRGEAAVP